MRDLEALLAYLEARAAMPFAWGPRANDCVSFAAGAVFVQTGRVLLPCRQWTTPIGAARVLREFGGLENAINNRLARIPPAQAMRGDVAAVHDELFGIRLMIVEGGTLAGPGARGIKRVPRAAMTAAWSTADV